jgi:cyclohexyl-isocyanide hydratase
MTVEVGFVVFPRFTQLDFAGPWEVFHHVPNTRAHILAESAGPVVTDTGTTLVATTPFASCPPLDVLLVVGGPGQIEQMDNAGMLDFLRRSGATARWVTSVCTGALLLGAAGLLCGYRATTYWACLPQLACFGAIPVADRVVIDRNRATGGGVTAGIDFGLELVRVLHGENLARAAQLELEYRPAPPFDGGHPTHEAPDVVELVRARASARWQHREQVSRRVGFETAPCSEVG